MSSFFLRFGAAFFMLSLLGGQGLAQIDKVKKESFVMKSDSVLARYKGSTFVFPYINKRTYYYNAKELENIRQAFRKREFEEAYKLLYRYVMNFGVENFYRDTDLLWQLGRLMELFDDIELAKSMYRIVLKHHRGPNVRQMELYYDSLTVNDKDYYVPLEYYYELVEYRKLIDTLRPPQGVLLNMGAWVNSLAPDYAPAISPSGDLLIFTSKRNKRKTAAGDELPNEDIFFCRKVEDYWTMAEEFKGLNTIYNEGSAHISKDGKTIYFSRCEAPDGYGSCDLYVASLQADSTWRVENLGPNVNSVAWDSHPSLSRNEDTLYFASDRIGGFGLSDIYFTYKRPDGSWAPAQNLGPTINTRRNEVSPFMHPVYDVLYFSSDGHLVNFGSFDIYKAYRVGGRWQEPINVGPLVNGAGSEYYFAIDPKAEYLYYARSETDDIDNLDLYSFPLPMEAQPEATTLFKGYVVDSETGNPFQGIVAVIDLDNGIEIAPKYLRPDGSYEFDLIKNNNYLVIITGEDFFRIQQRFYLEGDTTITLKATSLKFRKFQFASIEFEPSKAEILPEMEPDLNKVVLFLADNPTVRLRISGHTDSDGNEQFNLELSRRRAEAIRNYILQKGGFPPERIEAVGYGSSRPLVPEVTEEDKRRNRRVEFEIIN
ncbi:outer membrane protein OmpA-like peptidoglycan-associated protein [Thermonema lapsum]|uniref:Outer membrane protein OmpA-like peptidoglycan-associated protein n=1 Tax=Thermonema lapsum TaxID=28195 RepID=A0A846MU71_9BACT|nr:OmpA family protein [Thermonema lapsum]NIK74850.1 outer membrane protein OmpA-like peptidoglycan-associated protein [Thermonema lapsum]